MSKPLPFNPWTGRSTEGQPALTVDEARNNGFAMPWNFDPWTGMPRDVADVRSDPHMHRETPAAEPGGGALQYCPWSGVATPESDGLGLTADDARVPGLGPWSFNPHTGERRAAQDVVDDPHMRGADRTPLTLGQMQQLRRDLESDIYALVRQFERVTGVGVVGLDTHRIDTLSERRESQVSGVAVRVAL